MRNLSLLLVLGACAAEPHPAVPADAVLAEESPALPGAVAKEGADSLVLADIRKDRAKRLVNLALEEGESYAMLRELTTVAPGRLSGSANAARAVEWSLSKMREIGLENVRAETVMVPHWVRGEVERAELITSEGSESLNILALGGSIATPAGGIEAEVMMVRSFPELQARAEEAKGKIVLFNRRMPRTLLNTFRAYGQAVPQRGGGASQAAKVGGVFALVRSMTTRLDDSPHTGAMNYQDGVPKIPTAAISTNGADKIAALLDAGVVVRIRIELSCETLPDVESANAVGELRGSEKPDEVVVIGGHLDSWDVGTGAHDDGAGCIHCLEAVRLLTVTGMRPRRTIRVVLFMNEENGLRGGRGYLKRHLADMPKHFAAIETDTGGFEPRGFTSSARGEEFEVYRSIVDQLDPFGMGAYLPGGGGADIGPMRAHGVTLFSMMTVSHRYFDYHHSANDTIEAVNERELALGCGALAYVTWAIADLL